MSSSSIIFPLFEECKRFTLDPYWKDIFASCSINKFPLGLRYDAKHNHIIFKITKATKTTTDIIGLSPKPIETFQIMMRLFRDRLNMRSSRDIHLQKEELEEAKKTRTAVAVENDWKKIKPRSMRSTILQNFVIDLKQQYQLTNAETQHLIAVIHIAFQFHQIENRDILMEEGRITTIDGLEFDEETHRFYVNRSIASVGNGRTDKTVSTSRFYQTVDKFLKDSQQRPIKTMV